MHRFPTVLSYGLGVCLLVSAGAVAAQQGASPGQSKPEPGKPAANSVPNPVDVQAEPPIQINQGSDPSSFTVAPGDPQADAPSFVIQTTTRRVVVDVVVTGPDGNPVSGLGRQDFTVQENGKPQTVKGFEIHTPEEDRSALPPAPEGMPSHTFVNLERTPASGPMTVVLLDFLNTPLDNQAYEIDQIVRFLEKKPAGLQVAIFALGDQLSLVQGFTTDTNQLVAVMRSKAARPRMVAASEALVKAETTLDAFQNIGNFLSTMSGRKNLLWLSGSFDMLVLPRAQDARQGDMVVETETGSPSPVAGAVVTADNMISGATGDAASASGFSHGIGSMRVLEERLRKVAMALAVSQTSVYPIDARGLMADTGFSAGTAAASTMNADPKGMQGTPGMPTTAGGTTAGGQSHNAFMESVNASHATMEEIAEATGGHAFESTNGIAAAAGQAVSDGSSYYTLVYTPSNLNFDGGLRTIHVKLDKPGYKLAYRSAYYAVDPNTVNPAADSRDSMTAALLHGAPEAQGLVFKAQIDPEGEPKQAAADSPLAVKLPPVVSKRAKKDPDFLSGMVQDYSIRLAILARQLQFTASPDGQHHAALEIAVTAYAADGRKIGGSEQNLQASMPPMIYSHALEDGMFHSLKVELPVEAASVRFAVHDPLSHRTGSLEVPLPLAPAQTAAAVPPVTP